MRLEAPYPFIGEAGLLSPVVQSFHGGSIARMYGAQQDQNEQTACFVFEDLGTFPQGQKYAEIDLALAKSTLEFMAEYQAKFWLDDDLGNSNWIRNADWSVILDQDPMEAAVGWQVIEAADRLEKIGGLITAGEYLGERLDDLRNAMRSRPNSLTHNDFHQGNVLLRQATVRPMPVIFDWQMPACAGGTNDLAKFLMTAVPFEILAEQESNLVAFYVDSLVDRTEPKTRSTLQLRRLLEQCKTR
ncbi:MAG: phosphotransferase [Pirellulaceae bacterium]|nr:phosphotransferase [Pirellulaceae bacterium]